MINHVEKYDRVSLLILSFFVERNRSRNWEPGFKRVDTFLQSLWIRSTQRLLINPNLIYLTDQLSFQGFIWYLVGYVNSGPPKCLN